MFEYLNVRFNFGLFRKRLKSLFFYHEDTKSQRLKGENFVASCLGDFVVRFSDILLDSIFTASVE